MPKEQLVAEAFDRSSSPSKRIAGVSPRYAARVLNLANLNRKVVIASTAYFEARVMANFINARAGKGAGSSV